MVSNLIPLWLENKFCMTLVLWNLWSFLWPNIWLSWWISHVHFTNAYSTLAFMEGSIHVRFVAIFQVFSILIDFFPLYLFYQLLRGECWSPVSVDLSFSFNSSSFCSMYFEALLLDTYAFIIVMSTCCILTLWKTWNVPLCFL